MNDAALVLALLAACAATCYGLLAVWAALGRGPWFLRVAVVAAAIAALLPVPAYDLAVVFLSQSLTILVPLILLRARAAGRHEANIAAGSDASRKRAPQFSLVDLFLLTAAVAAVAAWVAYLGAAYHEFWHSYVLIGTGAGMLSLVAAWAALGRGWFWMRWHVLLVTAPSIGFAMRRTEIPPATNQALFPAYSFPVAASPAWFAPAFACLTGAMLALLLRLMRAGHPTAFRRNEAITAKSDESYGLHWARRAAQLTAVLLFMAVSLSSAWAYFEILRPPPIPPVKAPEPNGYLVLAKLGGKLEKYDILMVDAPGKDTLRTFVAANHERLKAAHAALSLPHLVPVDYTSTEVNMEWIGGLRQLGRAFASEGRLAELENRPDEAASHYLDVIRLGRVSADGGLAVDLLLGFTAEELGRRGLYRSVASVKPDVLRRLISELHQLDTSRESENDLRERSWRHEQHVTGSPWPSRISFLPPPPFNSTQRAMFTALKADTAKTRLLICDLALRIYRAEHGMLPQRLGQLAPDYLAALPKDPFGGGPLVYRPAGSTYLLYSIGYDLTNDGGTPVANGVLGGNGDLTLGP